MKPELRHSARRSVLHILFGVGLAVSVFLFPWLAVAVGLGITTAVFLAAEYARLKIPVFKKRLAPVFAPFMRQDEIAILTGSSYYLIGSLITVLVFPREIAVLAILFLAFGDPVAAAMGKWKGRNRFWGKSLEGDLACLAVCFAVGGVAVRMIGNPPLSIAIIGAIAATFFQSLPRFLNDNLTIPIGSALVMWAIGLI